MLRDRERQPVQKVGILGGMGPAAGAEFVRHFVLACSEQMKTAGIPVCDQAFPEHCLIQAPIPDRTSSLRQRGADTDGPLNAMLACVAQLDQLGVTAVAIACNTAHAWHERVQESFRHLNLLHMPREVSWALQQRSVDSVGLLATTGTYASAVYDRALKSAGIECHRPSDDERHMLMTGIYEGVKRGDVALAGELFQRVAQALLRRTGTTTLILGCTEIPLAMDNSLLDPSIDLVDPSRVLAAALARWAYGVTASAADHR